MKYHAQFLLDKEKDNPTARLRYRIKWAGYIVAFNLGYRIEIDKWSLDTQRCKINTTHGKKKVSASIINRKIQDYEKACEIIFNQYIAENKTPTSEEFREKFNIEIGKDKKKEIGKTFFDFFDEFILEESKYNQWNERTIIKFGSLKNHWYNFDKDIILNDVTEEKLLSFQYYLQESLKQKNSTIQKYLSSTKWFLKWAKRKKYITNLSFEDFKLKLKKVPKKIIFLTRAELNQLKEFDIPNNKKHLEKVRDIFMFQCFTGLRYSDVENLKKSDIKDNFIEVITIKTRDSLIIELNKHSKEILDKYQDFNDIEGRAFPVISNQKMNEYLKELGELAGIDEPIRETYYRGNERIDEITPKYALLGTHAGRRTFICNALSLGIPPQVVMKWTGHSDYKAMKPYIDIADEVKVNAMEKFNLL